MFKNIIQYILNYVFKIKTETTDKEINDNSKYARVYENIDNINFNAIFSNKLANYTISDSAMNIVGENARVDLLNKTGQSMWKKAKKISGYQFCISTNKKFKKDKYKRKYKRKKSYRS